MTPGFTMKITFVQRPLIKLVQGYDVSNGSWWKWVGWNGVDLCDRSFHRELICGFDGFDGGIGFQWIDSAAWRHCFLERGC